jgi:hypothetical protein
MKGVVKSPECLLDFSIPKYVYREIEMMIIRRFRHGSAVITENEMKNAIQKMMISLGENPDIFCECWLDIDKAFEANGWILERFAETVKFKIAQSKDKGI